MARNIDERLSRLNDRRKGTDRLGRLTEDARADVLAKSRNLESWQRRAVNQPYTRYALGAMQEVGPEYTRKSIETAERVGKQLESGLGSADKPVTFALQGSVPLNVHIRGVSDVDLLTLAANFLTYASGGPMHQAGVYTAPTSRTSVGVLWGIRSEAEELLKRRYWGATVDCGGAKAIKLSGGSLERPVDVVPSHWHDTLDYQRSRERHDRGVTILDKKRVETIDNLPFKHIKRVGDQDGLAFGGLRKAIRLAKTVKNDAQNENTATLLPSYDIAALLYHAELTALRLGYTYELAILAETQRFFDWCHHNQAQARALLTPDGARRIIDTDDKMTGVTAISVELDDLAKQVASEQLRMAPDTATWDRIGGALRGTVIPAAA